MLDYNFFTPYTVASRTYKTRVLVAALAATVFFAGLGGFFAVTEITAAALNKDISSMKTFLNSSETRQKLKEVEDKRKKLEVMTKYYNAVETISSQIDNGDRIKTSLLDSIAKTLPTDVSFKAVTISQDRVQIQGTAKSRVSVAELYHNLEGLSVFGEVHLASVAKDGAKTDSFTFSIECTLKGVVKSETNG